MLFHATLMGLSWWKVKSLHTAVTSAQDSFEEPGNEEWQADAGGRG